MLAKGSMSNWIMGELVRVYHNLPRRRLNGWWTRWSRSDFPQCGQEMTGPTRADPPDLVETGDYTTGAEAPE
jgi:hypothetical protein